MQSPTTQRVAANLRAELARRHLTQRDLAKALGVTQQAISQRMLGRIAFDVNQLGAAAEFLGITPEQLLASHHEREAAASA